MKNIVSVSTMFILLTTAFCHAGTIQLPKSGQTKCYDGFGSNIACTGTGQDGDLQKGVAWPAPRFTDNANGTVTDNLTGLVWLKNADCFGSQQWSAALSSANTLASGACGLTDGSVAGQWRLPNRKELMSLTDREHYNPALPAGHPFKAVRIDAYWSSSTEVGGYNNAWRVSMEDGSIVVYGYKTYGSYVWPVRAKQ